MFLLGEMPPGQARAYMVSVAEHAEAELTRYEQLRDAIDWDDSDAGFYGRAALEFGLRARGDGGRMGPLGGQGNRQANDPTDRCITIVSDISSTYRKRIRRFLTRKRTSMNTPFPQFGGPEMGRPGFGPASVPVSAHPRVAACPAALP